MTIEKFSELVAKALGYDDNSKIDERVVLAIADTCRAEVLAEMLKVQGGLTGEYVKSFDQPILYDGTRKLFYVEQPCALCSIGEFQAYRFVGPQDEETAYIPLKAGTIANISNLEISGLGGRVGYMPEGNKVFLWKLPVARPPKIRLKVVPSLLWLFDNTDDVDLIGTADVEQQVFDLTVQRLATRRGTVIDKYNDNNQRP